jgi:hypothetical protein
MSIDIDLTFPHSFECDVLEELPGTGVSRLHYFPGVGESGRDGVIVRVRPASHDAWVGVFAFGDLGKVGVSRVLSLAAADRICVVAQGAGYIVSAASPDDWEKVRATPIIDVRSAPAAGVTTFATHTDVVAYGEMGVKWRTKRLAWDGLKIIAVGDQTLVGEYWDIREDMMRTFEVDLMTGAAKGGVEG